MQKRPQRIPNRNEQSNLRVFSHVHAPPMNHRREKTPAMSIAPMTALDVAGVFAHMRIARILSLWKNARKGLRTATRIHLAGVFARPYLAKGPSS